MCGVSCSWPLPCWWGGVLRIPLPLVVIPCLLLLPLPLLMCPPLVVRGVGVRLTCWLRVVFLTLMVGVWCIRMG